MQTDGTRNDASEASIQYSLEDIDEQAYQKINHDKEINLLVETNNLGIAKNAFRNVTKTGEGREKLSNV